jgi:universal stress protein A
MKDSRKLKTGKSAAAGARAAHAGVSLRIESILVPLDFSTASNKALAYAVAAARQFKAKLTLLHVVEPIATPGFANMIPMVLEDDKLMATAKRELEMTVKAAGVPCGMVEKLLVRFGRSFHEIAEAARTRKVDLIIISTHGYTGLKHALLGSTTERVVRQRALSGARGAPTLNMTYPLEPTLQPKGSL